MRPLRLFLIRLRFRLGGITVRVCRNADCRSVSHVPAWWGETGCMVCLGCNPELDGAPVHVATRELQPREWHLPFGDW